MTGTHVLIRSPFGTTRVPWTDVTGFAVTGSGRSRGFSVLGRDRRRWKSVGCSPAGWSRREDDLAGWRLARTLEDQRLARNPGAASKVPSSPPGPVRGLRTYNWSRRPFIDAVLVAFLVLSAWIAWNSATNVGPAFRAADGAGTRGYFIPQTQSCYRGDCTWYGEFRLPDGTITRTGVPMAGPAAGDLQAGTPIAAIDVGDDDSSDGGSGAVFSVHDPGAWTVTVTELVLSACWAAGSLPLLLGQVPLRRRRSGNRSRLPGTWPP